MGRDSGFIALNATMASGEVNLCLIPECPFDVDEVVHYLEKRLQVFFICCRVSIFCCSLLTERSTKRSAITVLSLLLKVPDKIALLPTLLESTTSLETPNLLMLVWS